MKRKFRILRIWFYGKLPYAKRFRHWMNGQLFRDLLELTPHYLKNMQEKYGNEDFTKTMDLLTNKK